MYFEGKRILNKNINEAPLKNEKILYNGTTVKLNEKKGMKNWGKRLKRLHWDDFHYRGEIKIIGKATDMRTCKECKRVLGVTAFTTSNIRQDGSYYLMNMCRECGNKVRQEQREVAKLAPPAPDYCDSCYKSVLPVESESGRGYQNVKLQVDHIHGTHTFRGWICSNCNSGMGKLGDDLKGLLHCALYLENDKDKIIELLNKIYEESR
tara:strand:+ start:71 stop:694 length:624 start_codon:yes stop_codon:yes gene_type:complete